MAEPAITASVSLGTVAAFVLELTGVDLPPLIWSLIGAALMLAYSSQPISRWRAMAQTSLSGLLGALLGLGLAHLISFEQRHAVLLLCSVGGFGAYPLMQRVLAFVERKVDVQ